jgi:hypothetical protein
MTPPSCQARGHILAAASLHQVTRAHVVWLQSRLSLYHGVCMSREGKKEASKCGMQERVLSIKSRRGLPRCALESRRLVDPPMMMLGRGE